MDYINADLLDQNRWFPHTNPTAPYLSMMTLNMTVTHRLQTFFETRGFQNAIIAVVVFNAALLGAETSKTLMGSYGPLLYFLNDVCLGLFVIELALKLFAYRLRFFTSGWNLLDCAVVVVSLMPAGQEFSVLRALRIFRVLRIVSSAPRLRRVVEGFITALPGMGSVFLLMGIIFYIGAVMATTLFGAAFPEWFGTLGRSGYSLFQIMTLESWSMGIVRPVMAVYPYAWAFFVPFIMVTTFAVVNLLVGLIVNSMQEAHSIEENARVDQYREDVLKRLEAIEAQLRKK